MSRIDNIRELAEKVMEWTPAGQNHEAFTFADQVGRAKWIYRDGRGWDPFASASAALEVAEKMRERGWCVEVISKTSYWTARMHHFNDDEDDELVTEVGNTLPEAISTASLAAIRRK